MINAIVGRPRSGKSYESVVFHIIPAALDGRMLVTNIPVNLEYIAKYYGQEVADRITIVETNFGDYGNARPFSIPEDFTKYEWKNEKGQGPLFVVDEAHLCLGTDCKTPVREYLSMHGHYGHDIILLTQSPRKLHRDVKDMVEICWRTVKKSVFGDDDHYIKKTYHGVPVRNEEFVHEEEREYKSQFFGFYKSHTLSSSDVDEATAKDVKANLFPRKKLSLALVVLGGIFAAYTLYGVLNSGSSDEKKVKAGRSGSQPVVAQSSSSPARSAAPTAKSEIMHEDGPKHPFYKVELHVDGTAEYVDHGRMMKNVFFSASQNGQQIFRLSLADLRLAGYETRVMGDCAVYVQYGSYKDWITCDSPQIAMAPEANTPVSESGS